MKSDYQSIVTLVSLAFKAGGEIMKLYNQKIKSELKDNLSPVTQADRVSDEIIVNGLNKEFAKIQCISEESYSQINIKSLNDIFFLVDPLDGTKEFIEKNDEFTVNIALINKKKPELGIIYAPAKNKLFFTDNNNSAYELEVENYQNEVNLNRSKRISVSKETKNLIAITSRSHNNETTNNFLEKYKIKEKIICGSSLKFCLVANGQANIYPRLGPTKEWDTAAGHAILENAGGKIKSLNDKELLYGKKNEDFLNPEFIASNF